MRVPIRRLYIDIEVTPNVVFTWNTGWKLIVPVENIVTERAIICVAYKWEGEREVHCLQWQNGNDKSLLKRLVKVLAEAQEVCGHNSSRFDIPWIRTRCIYHGIEVPSGIKEVDTLRMARKSFRFNSNKLNYIAKFLGVGSKLHTDFNLWKEVVAGDELSLERIKRYCKNDVRLTEKVYHKLASYSPPTIHVAVLNGGNKEDCPRCASTHVQRRGLQVSARGYKTQRYQCLGCGGWYTAPQSALKGK